MTFGETRQLLKRFRQTARFLRARIDAAGIIASYPLSFALTVSVEDFEALEFGLSHLKVWVPALDDEQDVILGSGRMERQNFLFRRSGVEGEHLMFKGVTILKSDL